MVVLAAIDRSERAESVIYQAKTLADDIGLELHVVHVGEAMVPHYKGGYDQDRADVISKQKATAIARDAAKDILGDDPFHPVGLQGDPATEILTYANEQEADYIVVRARKQSPTGQAVFGSVTQSLLLNADCPIVAVASEAP